MPISIADVLTTAPDGEAQYLLARMYEQGLECKPDFNVALRWYQLAADAGCVKAKLKLSFFYMEGEKVNRDTEQAERLLREALPGIVDEAEKGDAVSQAYLASLFMRGIGVQHDEQKGLVWLKESAEHGCAEAQYRLGELYKEGRGVEKSQSIALRWFKEAARQGHKSAIAILEGRDPVVDEIVHELAKQ